MQIVALRNCALALVAALGCDDKRLAGGAFGVTSSAYVRMQ